MWCTFILTSLELKMIIMAALELRCCSYLVFQLRLWDLGLRWSVVTPWFCTVCSMLRHCASRLRVVPVSGSSSSSCRSLSRTTSARTTGLFSDTPPSIASPFTFWLSVSDIPETIKTNSVYLSFILFKKTYFLPRNSGRPYVLHIPIDFTRTVPK